MPRPMKDLIEHKSYIVHLREENHSLSDIIRKLLVKRFVRVGKNTLMLRLAEWGFQKHVFLEDSSVLRMRIIALTYEFCFNDKNTYEILCREEHVLDMRAFVRLRKSMSIHKRVSVFNREEVDAELIRMIEQEFERGTIDGYGKNHLYYHFRTRGNIISRYVHVRTIFHINLLT